MTNHISLSRSQSTQQCFGGFLKRSSTKRAETVNLWSKRSPKEHFLPLCLQKPSGINWSHRSLHDYLAGLSLWLYPLLPRKMFKLLSWRGGQRGVKSSQFIAQSHEIPSGGFVNCAIKGFIYSRLGWGKNEKGETLGGATEEGSVHSFYLIKISQCTNTLLQVKVLHSNFKYILRLILLYFYLKYQKK